jgi:hypothetical protein
MNDEITKDKHIEEQIKKELEAVNLRKLRFRLLLKKKENFMRMFQK